MNLCNDALLLPAGTASYLTYRFSVPAECVVVRVSVGEGDLAACDDRAVPQRAVLQRIR